MITVFEIGAHHCEDTEKILDATGADRYYAFEPDPWNIPVAMERLTRLGLIGKVGLVHAAVAHVDKAGMPLHRSSNGGASSSILTPTGHLKRYPEVKFTMESARVNVIRLDTFCKRFQVDKVDFIYMDVQGAEHLVIAGGQKTFGGVDYLLSEYYEEPMYLGQKTLAEWKKMLPGKWEIVKKMDFDVVLENVTND